MLVLLIEDDNFFQHFYSEKLRESGFEVEVAGNGEEGVLNLKKIMPNVILLDLIMPKKNGFEFLEDFAQIDTPKKPPVIVFSTLGQDDDIAHAMKLGATGYVNKTFFDFDNLLKKIFEVTVT